MRVESIDHLRGIFACVIMIYHYISWSFPNLMAADSLLSILGYYAVSAFFVISGISLALAYDDRLNSGYDLRHYAIKRLLRIAPLFLGVTIAQIILSVLTSDHGKILDLFSGQNLFANFTLGFAIIGPEKAIPTGGWSIGNELFFYLYFPALIWLLRKQVCAAPAVFLVAVLLYVYWAFVAVDLARIESGDAWRQYVSNANQMLFFICGVFIGYFRSMFRMKALFAIAAIVFSLAIFLIVSVEDRWQLIVGWPRIWLGFATILFVYSVFSLNWQLRGKLSAFLTWVGLISYSVYLLHPLVLPVIGRVCEFFGSNTISIVVASIIATLGLSGLVYKYFELPIMRLAKRRQLVNG